MRWRRRPELAGASGEVGVQAGGAVVEVAAVEHGVVQVDELGDVQAAREGFRQEDQSAHPGLHGAVEGGHGVSSLHQVSRSSLARRWHMPLRSMTFTTGARMFAGFGVWATAASSTASSRA